VGEEPMMLRITLLWIVGIVLIVPYSTYQLLFRAGREDYAFLIVAPLFWIFGFWGVVGPCVAAWRVHTLMKALEAAQGSDQIREAFERNEGKEVVVDLIASEYRLPRFVARWVFDRLMRKVQEKNLFQV
jgi:hypothetical protein